METQDEEEVFLPLTSMFRLKCDNELISTIKTEESSEVLNTQSLNNIDPLQAQTESQMKQSECQTNGHKHEKNRCRVCLLPGSVSTLPIALRDTYWTLCNASDQSSMPEPSLCLVCRRLLYNAHKYKELCRASHAFLTQKFNTEQLETFSKNLHESFHHPDLTIVHNVVENCNYFNIKDESDKYDDGPEVKEYRPKVVRDEPKVNRGAQILNKIVPDTIIVPNVKKELFLEIHPLRCNSNIRDGSSDTDCNDDDDKETFGKADLEIISKNINTLIAVAERKEIICSQNNTTSRNNTCQRKIPSVLRKTTDPKTIKKVETKRLTYKRGHHFVHDPKVFDEYIETSRLTLEDQKNNMEEKKMSVAYRDALYKCDICYKIFNTEDTLKRHVECHSNKIGKHVCTVCYLHFATAARLSNHRRCHMYSFTCKKCIFTCNLRTVAQMHVFQTHQGRRYTCDLCNITYHRSTSYLSHVRIHHPPSHACQLCGYSFLSEYGVACHKLRMHRFDDRPIPEDGPVCSKCNTKFVDKDPLETHLKVSPCANNRSVRNSNSRSTRIPKDLVLRLRHPATVTCEKCNLKLKSFNQYQRHFEEKHPNETITQHHYGSQILCDICGKMFINLTALSIHLPSHGTGANFKCDECGRTYKSKVGLYFHRKKHEGVMFPCKVCKKEFSNSSNRDRHYKYTHTKVEIVKCEYCDKEFKSVIQKGIHVTHVHMNVPYKKRDRKRERANTKLDKRDKDGRWGGRIGI